MIVVWTAEAAQSYIAQARRSGRPRPSRWSSDSRGIAGQDRGVRRCWQPFRPAGHPTATLPSPRVVPHSFQGAPMFSPIALALVGSLALPGARLTPQTVADRPAD